MLEIPGPATGSSDHNLTVGTHGHPDSNMAPSRILTKLLDLIDTSYQISLDSLLT